MDKLIDKKVQLIADSQKGFFNAAEICKFLHDNILTYEYQHKTFVTYNNIRFRVNYFERYTLLEGYATNEAQSRRLFRTYMKMYG